MSLNAEIHVQFKLTGSEVDVTLFQKAVDLSMTRYCGVSAMLLKAVPVLYSGLLNDEKVFEGKAEFAEK